MWTPRAGISDVTCEQLDFRLREQTLSAKPTVPARGPVLQARRSLADAHTARHAGGFSHGHREGVL